MQDPDAQRFRDYAEGTTNDSPVENDWRSAAPRCSNCHRPIEEDEGCLDVDCIAEQELGNEENSIMASEVLK